MKRSRIDSLIMSQEKLSSLTRKDIETVQLRKLNSLLYREKERGGFYKNLPEQLDSLKELENLPFTTDEDLAANPSSMLLSSQADIQRVLSDATSGTTGHEKRVFYSLGDCENTIRLFKAGLGEFVFPGNRTMICMPFSGPYGLGDLISEAISRLGAVPIRAGCNLSYGQLKALMLKEKPDTYVGMPVNLLSMLRVCGRQSIERALVSADSCPENVIHEIEEILGTRLFPHYGSREMGLGGAICCPAHEGMHLRENHVIAEIIDDNGKVLPHGKYGQLVITTIGMEAMPLIRYKTGDYTKIFQGRCPCGSEVIRLDDVRRTLTGRDIAYWDNRVFTDKRIVDYSLKYNGTNYIVNALTLGNYNCSPLFRDLLGKECLVNFREVHENDKPLYRGKRKVLN
ncbi:MAG: DVU_1553 family AMP-dependent CoA ligase [Candidatus Limivicinus sp.]|jgi:phenylacetate-CoA ligase